VRLPRASPSASVSTCHLCNPSFASIKRGVFRSLPSGNLLHSYGKSPFIVDFPIKNGGSFHSYVTNYQRVTTLMGLYSNLLRSFDWPTRFHRGVSQSPLWLHGLSQWLSQWISQWISHISMAYPWLTHGLSMAYPTYQWRNPWLTTSNDPFDDPMRIQ